MNKLYVEKVQSGYRFAGTRVSLDSIVYACWRGQTAESIAQSFPVLRLEEVYGAIAFYLTHREEVDAYLEEAKVAFAALRETSRKDPIFHQKIADAKRHYGAYSSADTDFKQQFR